MLTKDNADTFTRMSNKLTSLGCAQPLSKRRGVENEYADFARKLMTIGELPVIKKKYRKK